MPEKFDPNADPELTVPIWIRLLDLRSDLWNLRAVSKIASCFGNPVSTDFGTLRRENMDGPRVQILVNAAKRQQDVLCMKFPSGEVWEQKVEFEFLPKFCHACKLFGHYTENCQGKNGEPGQAPRGGIFTGSAYRKGGAKPSTIQGPKQAAQPKGDQPLINKMPPPAMPPAQGMHRSRSVSVTRATEGNQPRFRSKSRPRKEWKPTGATIEYPIATTYLRQRDPLNPSDANIESVTNVEGFSLSPNKFSILEKENDQAEEATTKEVTVEEQPGLGETEGKEISSKGVVTEHPTATAPDQIRSEQEDRCTEPSHAQRRKNKKKSRKMTRDDLAEAQNDQLEPKVDEKALEAQSEIGCDADGELTEREPGLASESPQVSDADSDTRPSQELPSHMQRGSAQHKKATRKIKHKEHRRKKEEEDLQDPDPAQEQDRGRDKSSCEAPQKRFRSKSRPKKRDTTPAHREDGPDTADGPA